MQKNPPNFYAIFIKVNQPLLSPPSLLPPAIPARHTFRQGCPRVFIYPALDPQDVVLCYSGEVCPLRDLPPNHPVSILAAPAFVCAVWMAVVYMRPVLAAGRGPRHYPPSLGTRFLSTPMIKCKKTPKKFCRFLAGGRQQKSGGSLLKKCSRYVVSGA